MPSYGKNYPLTKTVRATFGSVDGDSTCIGMKADMDFPEWYSGCFFNDRDRLTTNVIGDTVEMRSLLNDLLRGNEFDLSEIFDSPILRFKTVDSLGIILL